jgi:hypothetical protein
MGGLVIGITVRPGAIPSPTPAAATAARKLQLAISENPGKIPLYDLEVNDPLRPTATDKNKSPSLLGPPIFLTRGEATEIEVKNQSNSPTVIHWHGIELLELRRRCCGLDRLRPADYPASCSWNVVHRPHDSAAGGNLHLSHTLAR